MKKGIKRVFSKVCSIALLAAIVGGYCPPPTLAADHQFDKSVNELISENTRYFVNAGSSKLLSDIWDIGDSGHILNSRLDQVYGADEGTGKTWGYLPLPPTAASEAASNSPEESFRYVAYEKPDDRERLGGIHYKFELPEGNYEVTVGIKLPPDFKGRRAIVLAEEEVSAKGNIWLKSGTLSERSFAVKLRNDTELDIDILDPAFIPSINTDALVNYIVITELGYATKEDMEQLILKAEAIEDDNYTKESWHHFKKALKEGRHMLKKDASKYEPYELQDAYDALELAMERITPVRNSFLPGEEWVDVEGKLIQAHGGGIWYDKDEEIYYWYGEDKTHGYRPLRGVRCYSSKDLYNWKDEGLALTAISSMAQFEKDPLISKLYKHRTEEDKRQIFEDLDVNMAVMERPKVIYNQKTDKWVMWFHADGPTKTSSSNYARAKAGVAVSHSPTGPFEFIASYRLDECPPGANDGAPNNRGMARDMNLFVDDDQTGYIIYASEHNGTLYISKLTEDYLDVAGWNKDGKVGKKGRPIRDTEYKAEYGEDYIRIFEKQWREAPALFKYDGQYYLITSGCTGWRPNPARYGVADAILGNWVNKGDPCVGDTGRNTFSSQSTFVIPLDTVNGKYIFMGDRWYFKTYNNKPNNNPLNYGNLSDSRYIWLPIQFTSDGDIRIKWYDEWSVELLDTMGKTEILTEMPQKVEYGTIPDLPSRITVLKGTIQEEIGVQWQVDETTFQKIGTVTVEGLLEDGRMVFAKMDVVPGHVMYFVNCGEGLTEDYLRMKAYMQDTLLNKDAADQVFDEVWGHKDNNSKIRRGGDIYDNLRYASDPEQRNLTYAFKDLEPGHYSVYLGFYDPWYQYSKGGRKANIIINGETKQTGLVIDGGYKQYDYCDIHVTGDLEIVVQPAAQGPNTDVQMSWIMIAKKE